MATRGESKIRHAGTPLDVSIVAFRERVDFGEGGIILGGRRLGGRRVDAKAGGRAGQLVYGRSGGNLSAGGRAGGLPDERVDKRTSMPGLLSGIVCVCEVCYFPELAAPPNEFRELPELRNTVL